MATNLQVNASTQQAVGAFNALAAAIANTTNQFNAMNAAMNRGNSQAGRFSGSITAINSAFNSLTSIASGALNVLKMVGAGVEFVFSSILKELDKLQGFQAIMSVSTKEATDVSNAYEFLRKTADRLGVQFDSLTGNYSKLVAALPQGAKGLEIAEKAFMGVAMAARTLHATNADTQLMFYAVTQMASKGTVSMEELRRQLGEKLPGTIQIAAKGLNTIPEKLEEAIRKGIVSSEKFLPIFGDALIRTFGDSSERASQSVSASINRLTNVWVDFVKAILDSGAGTAIVGVFDALREKLSDPYLIQRFAELVKYLAERFADFINKITTDDIRNGFDTFTHGVEIAITLIGKLIEGLTWIINNGGKAGAALGFVAGASVGMVTAGPIGAVALGTAGAAGGAYLGNKLSPSSAELAQRAASDAAAAEAKAAASKERELLKFNELIPLLQQFKGLNNFNGLDNLFKAENLNTKTLADLNRILTGKEFKTDAAKAAGVKDYAKYGTVLSPATSTLADVLGGKGKKSNEQKLLDASEARAMGLTPTFQRELANYNTLLKQGKLSTEEYGNALQHLIQKQPYMIEYQRKLKEAQQGENKAISEHITFVLKQVEVKEELRQHLEDELRLSRLHGEELALESQVTQEVNRYREVGLKMTDAELTALREKFRIINDTKRISGVEDQVLAATLDKYKGHTDTLKAISNLKQNEPGFGQAQAQDYMIGKNESFYQGTQEYVDYQKRALEEMYSYINSLRNADLISDRTAQQLKAREAAKYQEVQLQQVSSFFGGLASLQQAGSKRLFEVGKAAALAQALIDGYAAIQKAYSSSPYPYNLLAVAATSASVYANVQRIRGTQAQFMDGGYTGDGPRGGVAGVTHGQEFVVNSAATARNRALLEDINAGRSANTGSSPVTVIVNAPPGSKVEKEERDGPNGREIEITVKKILIDDVQRGGPVSSSYAKQFNLNRAAGSVR